MIPRAGAAVEQALLATSALAGVWVQHEAAAKVEGCSVGYCSVWPFREMHNATDFAGNIHKREQEVCICQRRRNDR